jgi:hypothetical protein
MKPTITLQRAEHLVAEALRLSNECGFPPLTSVVEEDDLSFSVTCSLMNGRWWKIRVFKKDMAEFAYGPEKKLFWGVADVLAALNITLEDRSGPEHNLGAQEQP